MALLCAAPGALAAIPQDPNIEARKIQKLNDDRAILFLTAEIQKDPKNPVLYIQRGKAYSGNQDYALALADFDRALQLDPKLAAAHMERAVIYLAKEEYDRCWESVHAAEALGGQFWPSFTDALKTRSGRDK